MGDPAGISGEVIVKALTALARPTRQPWPKQVRDLLAERSAESVRRPAIASDCARQRASCASIIPVDVVDRVFARWRSPSTRLRLFERSKIRQRDFRFGVPAYGREQLDYLDFAIEKARREAGGGHRDRAP